MRAILSLSIMVLVGLLGLLGLDRLTRQSRASEGVREAAVSVLVGSRGYMLPSARMDGGRQYFENAISVGDLLLTQTAGMQGLMLASFDPDFELQHFESYGLAPDGKDLERLIESVQALLPGTLLVAAVVGDVHPGPAALAQLDAMCSLLGNRVSPFRAQRASWAVLCLRQETRWITLAEAYSEERGLNLAFTLRRDLRSYAEHEPRFYFVRADEPQVLSLYDDRLSISSGSAINGSSAQGIVPASNQPSLFLRMRSNSKAERTAHMGWDRVGLGRAPRFETLLSPSDSKSGAMRCRLLIDGKAVDEIEISAAAPVDWIPWSVDLAAWAGAEVSLSIESTMLKQSGGAAAIWGNSRLTWEPLR